MRILTLGLGGATVATILAASTGCHRDRSAAPAPATVKAPAETALAPKPARTAVPKMELIGQIPVPAEGQSVDLEMPLELDGGIDATLARLVREPQQGDPSTALLVVSIHLSNPSGAPLAYNTATIASKVHFLSKGYPMSFSVPGQGETSIPSGDSTLEFDMPVSTWDLPLEIQAGSKRLILTK